MSDFHDYRQIDNMDFDCHSDTRKEIVIQLPRNVDDPEQNILILVITEDSVIFDYYTDGELMTSMKHSHQEWFDTAVFQSESRANHPTNSARRKLK